MKNFTDMEEQIISHFAEAWRTLNAELIIKHLSEDFRYDSQWVFDWLDYEGYKEYIIGKFKTFSSAGEKIIVNIVNDPYLGGKMLYLNQSGNKCFYRIQISEGKVTKGDLCMF